MDDLYWYYEECCSETKSARNHLALSDAPRRIAQWACPAAAYWANQKKLWISHQADYAEFRDEYGDGNLLY